MRYPGKHAVDETEFWDIARYYTLSLAILRRSIAEPGAAQSEQIYGSGVYPANLCPLSCLVELASLGEDFG